MRTAQDSKSPTTLCILTIKSPITLQITHFPFKLISHLVLQSCAKRPKKLFSKLEISSSTLISTLKLVSIWQTNTSMVWEREDNRSSILRAITHSSIKINTWLCLQDSLINKLMELILCISAENNQEISMLFSSETTIPSKLNTSQETL